RRRAVARVASARLRLPPALPALRAGSLRRRVPVPPPVRGRPRGGVPLPGRALADDRGRAAEQDHPGPHAGIRRLELNRSIGVARPESLVRVANFASGRPSDRTWGSRGEEGTGAIAG